MGRTGDQSVVAKHRIQPGVGHDHDAVAQHRMGTEGDVPAGLGGLEPDAGLEPLTVLRDQADEGGGNVTDTGRQGGQVVELGLGPGVEHVIGMQRRQALSLGPGLVVGQFVCRHQSALQGRSAPGRD